MRSFSDSDGFFSPPSSSREKPEIFLETKLLVALQTNDENECGLIPSVAGTFAFCFHLCSDLVDGCVEIMRVRAFNSRSKFGQGTFQPA